jgi:hypothetical protein
MIFWLKNRQPDKWRDKTETDMTVTPAISPEELHRLREESMQRAYQRHSEMLLERELKKSTDNVAQKEES